jgi:hypothetical protein
MANAISRLTYLKDIAVLEEWQHGVFLYALAVAASPIALILAQGSCSKNLQ